MSNSPAQEKENPLVGKAGAGETGAPSQLTDAQQRPGASNAEGSKGADAPGEQGGVSDAAIKAADAAASSLGEAGGSRKDVETGNI